MSHEAITSITGSEHLSAIQPPSKWEASFKYGSPKRWQEPRYLENNRLEGEDQVEVIRWNFGEHSQLHDSHRTPGSRPDPVGKLQRRCWLLMILASLIWGGLSGAAFSSNHFPITPSDALLGSFGIVVLALTLYRLGREN